ncbi:MAG: trypsin-like serine protease [Deltaproteobacteria bacterium]|nr:trypsin-like serine protease [Deltaproteobacteria bacterium]
MKRYLYGFLMGAGLAVALAFSASAALFETTDIPQTAASGSAYWTRDRMINAKPFPLPEMIGAPSLKGTIYDQGEPVGAPGATKGVAPGSSFLLSKAGESVAIAFAGGIQPAANGYDYPPPQTTYNELTSLYSTYPYSTVGRVFFSSGGSNYSCSGSSIGNRAVLTAGHCVSNGAGAWHTNWNFTPAYQNGSAPYGVWSANWLSTFFAWHFSSSFCRDVGFAAVSDINGATLSSKVGALGFAYNSSVVQHWDMFGYPAGSPYDGKWLVKTEASYSKTDNPGCTPYTVGMGTAQTGGCSGGPRIMNFYPGVSGAANYANGVNSYIYTSSPKELFSPYFDAAVKSLRDTAVAR